jgi:transmembrane protein 94
MHAIDKENPERKINMMNVESQPTGVEGVLHSLRELEDDIPLLVPLFCDAAPRSCHEMVSMQQEYGQHIVLCVGSATDAANTGAFAQADISFAIEPEFKGCAHEVHPHDRSGKAEFDGLAFDDVISSAHFRESGSSHSLSCDLTALPCHFILHRYSKFSHIVTMVKTGRHMLVNVKMLLLFYMFGCIWVHAANVLAALVSPHWFVMQSGIQLLWVTVVLLPLFCVMLLFTAREQAIMHQFPEKNSLVPERITSAVRRHLYRGLVAVLVSVSVFLAALNVFWEDFSPSLFFGVGLTDDDVAKLESPKFEHAQAYAQECVLWALIFLFSFQSWSYAHHSASVLKAMCGSKQGKREARVFRSRQFWFMAVAVALQAVWTAISLSWRPSLFSVSDYKDEAWWILAAVFLSIPLLVVALDECLKVFERKEYADHQLLLKLLFDTKLGRYSPR